MWNTHCSTWQSSWNIPWIILLHVCVFLCVGRVFNTGPGLAMGFPAGAPMSSCEDMMPRGDHGDTPANNNSPHSVQFDEINKHTYLGKSIS